MKDSFQKHFGIEPTVIAKAPGRLEILGNHTDYNEGTVLSVAVDRAMTVAAAKVEGKTCELYDLVINSTKTFDLDKLDNPTKGDWSNYVKGVVQEFQKRGYTVPAFKATLKGTVPLSAGMSSSAALEMAFVLVIEKLAGLSLDWKNRALIGQAAENNYVGAKTGLLDQVSSLMGKENQLVYSDFRSLQVHNVPIPAGTAFVVANCMVKHNLTNEYNERREACELAAKILGVKALRDVTPEQLKAAKDKAAKDKLPEVAYLRALHVVGEIDRVEKGSQALAAGDLDTFGRLMFESQYSSTNYFDNSIKELDIMVELAKTIPGHIGARLSGGGFGGITVHLVKADQAEQYCKTLADLYQKKTGLKTEAMICTAAQGAHYL